MKYFPFYYKGSDKLGSNENLNTKNNNFCDDIKITFIVLQDNDISHFGTKKHTPSSSDIVPITFCLTVNQ